MSGPLPEQIDRIRAIDELKAQGFANDEAVRLVILKEAHMARVQRPQAVRVDEYHSRYSDPPVWAMNAAGWLLCGISAAVMAGLVWGGVSFFGPLVRAALGRVFGS